MPPRILAFGGSLRRDSWNQKLVEIAAQGARDAGGEVTVIHLREYPLPVYDGDLETDQGLPEQAIALKDLFRTNQGLIVASPEYNSSVSAALKNVIDWLSRPQEGCSPLDCFDQKVAGLLATSPGAMGGLRGLTTLRSILGNIRVTVLPHQVAVPRSHEALAEPGKVDPESLHEQVLRVGRDVAEATRRLIAP